MIVSVAVLLTSTEEVPGNLSVSRKYNVLGNTMIMF